MKAIILQKLVIAHHFLHWQFCLVILVILFNYIHLSTAAILGGKSKNELVMKSEVKCHESWNSSNVTNNYTSFSALTILPSNFGHFCLITSIFHQVKFSENWQGQFVTIITAVLTSDTLSTFTTSSSATTWVYNRCFYGLTSCPFCGRKITG